MEFQNTTYVADLVKAAHYNRHYNPVYALRKCDLYTSGYVACQGIQATLRESYLGSDVLAPISAKLVADIDFSQPYLNRDMDPVSGLFAGKTLFGKAGVENALCDIAARYKLMNDNIRGLDYQICAVDSRIDQLPTIGFGFSKDLDRTRVGLEDSVRRLEQEQMKERVSAWKDITRMKSDLMESLQQYTAGKASSSMLNTGDQNH